VLFVFRGIRGFQVLLAVVALGSGIGAAVLIKGVSDGGSWVGVVGAALLGLAFLWSFAAALRAPTSFVAVSDERTRIRFAGFIDTVVENGWVESVRVERRALWKGLGVRTNFRGQAALVSGWGEVAVMRLRRPVRVWLIPGLFRVRVSELAFSVRNPGLLAERFGGDRARASQVGKGGRRMRRGGP
jgi:hypothetical protein